MTATQEPITATELQRLVDEHAVLLLPIQEIASHLRKSHGVPPERLVPPPSKRALRDRDLVQQGDLSPLDSIGGRVLRRGPVSAQSSNGDALSPATSTASNGLKPRLGLAQSLRDRYPSAKETVFDDAPEGVFDNPGAFFREIYVPIGPTFLDRYIQGTGGLIQRLSGGEFNTKFEAASSPLRRQQQRGAPELDQPASRLAFEKGETDFAQKYIDLAIAPWLLGDAPTDNIQIDAHLAESLLQVKLPPLDSIEASLRARAFYVDIEQKASGERTLSGVFCTPHPDGTGFSYLAVVEWTQQGIESFVLHEHGSDRFFIVPASDLDEIPAEAVDALYEPLVVQARQVALAARLHYCSLSPAKRAADVLRSVGSADQGKRRSEKKAHAKEKTHSYFRVVRVEAPETRGPRAGQRGFSWSLDHLVSVSGHFRWQAYGPGLKHHKLIWVDAYEKGVGGHHRPTPAPELYMSPLRRRRGPVRLSPT